MDKINEKWYDDRSGVIKTCEDHVVIDYGCEGKGLVTTYFVLPGIQLVFLDLVSDETFSSKVFDPNILQITYCISGRYECEFSDNTSSYLPEGYMSIFKTRRIPMSFSFPLGKCLAVSLVIDKDKTDRTSVEYLKTNGIDLMSLGDKLGDIFVFKADKLKNIFDDLLRAGEKEDISYFRIKTAEILYFISKLSGNNGCDLRYYDSGKISAVKGAREVMIKDPGERIKVEELAALSHMSVSLFNSVFSRIYGDTPYSYLKKYKMNIAASRLSDSDDDICDIAMDLGYNNASKFSVAFKSYYGQLPKDYRKKNRK